MLAAISFIPWLPLVPGRPPRRRVGGQQQRPVAPSLVEHGSWAAPCWRPAGWLRPVPTVPSTSTALLHPAVPCGFVHQTIKVPASLRRLIRHFRPTPPLRQRRRFFFSILPKSRRIPLLTASIVIRTPILIPFSRRSCCIRNRGVPLREADLRATHPVPSPSSCSDRTCLI